jgi:hypothetical protein
MGLEFSLAQAPTNEANSEDENDPSLSTTTTTTTTTIAPPPPPRPGQRHSKSVRHPKLTPAIQQAQAAVRNADSTTHQSDNFATSGLSHSPIQTNSSSRACFGTPECVEHNSQSADSFDGAESISDVASNHSPLSYGMPRQLQCVSPELRPVGLAQSFPTGVVIGGRNRARTFTSDEEDDEESSSFASDTSDAYSARQRRHVKSDDALPGMNPMCVCICMYASLLIAF